MLDNKRKTPFIALIGAAALGMSAPAVAQDAAPADPAAAEATTTEAPAAEPAPAPEPEAAEEAAGGAHELTITQMFLDAQPVGKAVLIPYKTLFRSGSGLDLLLDPADHEADRVWRP